jgi:hypothetical protein
VLEPELLVSFDARHGLAANQIPGLERSEKRGKLGTPGDLCERPSPEDAADDRRVDEDTSLVCRE